MHYAAANGNIRALEPYHDPADEPVHPRFFDFAFEQANTREEMRILIAEEVAAFKAGMQ